MTSNKRIRQILEKIRIERLKKGYTQEYMAVKLGCNYTTYGKIESASTALTVERLIEIADILKLPAADFLHQEESSAQSNTRIKGGKAKILLEIELNDSELHKIGTLKKLMPFIKK